MQITESLKSHLNHKLSSLLGQKVVIQTYTKLHGGSVNYSYQIETNREPFFIKLNRADSFPNMFGLEQLGLHTIEESNTLEVPRIIAEGECEGIAYLILEFIETGKETNSFWEKFGRQLAALHQIKEKQFGLAYSNYIGSLPQSNELTEDWSTFFGQQRIMSQAKMAFDSARIDQSLLSQLESIINNLNNLFPLATPSLLHGDLWSGNFMVHANGNPIVIDPAIYFGNREMDLAMSLLFGGFQKRFYDAYQEVYPLSKAWETRVDLCNVYPLLVHVNLFGASYAQRLKSAIKRYL